MKRSDILIVIVVALAVTVFAAHRLPFKTDRAVSLDPKGQLAPDFELTSLEGKAVRLSDFRGRPVVVNFWATWCGPCRVEMPWFVELQKQYQAQGVQVLGVAVDDSGRQEVAGFARKVGVNYPVLLGNDAVGDAYGGLQFLPATFYINRDGYIVDRVFGLLGRDEIEQEFKKTLQ